MKIMMALSLALALGVGGCGDEGGDRSVPQPGGPQDDAGGTDPPPDTDQPPTDTEQPPPDAAPPAGPNKLTFEAVTDDRGLQCTTSCLFVLNAGETRELAVYYRDAKNAPIENGTIEFDTDAPEQHAKLAAKTAFTTDQGRASISLQTFEGATGQVSVTAKVGHDPGAGTLTFQLLFSQVDSPPLKVNTKYVGKQSVSSFEVRVFLMQGGKPLCSDVHPAAPGAALPAVQTKSNLGLAETAVFDALPLPLEGSSMWTVQVRGPSGGVPAVVGCEHSVELITGETKEITVEVADLPLKIAGEYTATTWMDLHTGIGGTAGDVIGLLIGLFTEPGKTAVVWACNNASGTLDTICKFLVDGSGNLTGTGQTVATAADKAFQDLIAAQLGGGYFTAANLAELLKQIRFKSTISLTAEPSVPVTSGDGAQFADGSVIETWDILSYYWKFGLNCDPVDDECGLQHVKLPDIYNQTLTSTPVAGVDSTPALWIAAHEVPGFSYGTLLNFLLEKKLLPLLFGDGTNGTPDIKTYDDLIATLFGDKYCLEYDDCCEYFAAKIQDDIPSLLLPLAEPACELAIPSAANWIRDQIAGLTGSLVIGTPQGQPCIAQDQDGDLDVDNIGSKNKICAWDAKWEIAGELFSPESVWFAIP